MVTSTLMTTCAPSAALVAVDHARLDRYRPVLSLPSEPVGRVIDVEPRTISPVIGMCTGEVRPDADDTNAIFGCEKSPMNWHAGTGHITTTVFGGRFAGLDDIQTRVGPPPPRRPSA